ncbi:unnamed protein product [Ectocarpus sp. CCAP 1310/34]|nr:unnamed protein product [Ectocarpus sp. CCAP 1310/34]
MERSAPGRLEFAVVHSTSLNVRLRATPWMRSARTQGRWRKEHGHPSKRACCLTWSQVDPRILSRCERTMKWFPAWPMLLLLVAITLLPFADAFKGQGVLRVGWRVVPTLRSTEHGTTSHPTLLVSAAPTTDVTTFHVDDLPSCMLPPFLAMSVVDETVAVTSGMSLCEEPGSCAVATLSSVAPLDVAAFRVDHVPSCPWPSFFHFPDLEPAGVGAAPFDDGGASCVWPPFLGVAETDQTSPMPLCDEPGACAVASLSLMKTPDLVQMLERALLAEAGRAALQQLIIVLQTQRMLPDWDLSMVCFAGHDSTQHVRVITSVLYPPPPRQAIPLSGSGQASIGGDMMSSFLDGCGTRGGEEEEEEEEEETDNRSGLRQTIRRARRGGNKQKAVGEGEGDDSNAANGSNGMSGGGEGGQNFSAGT